MEELFLKLSEIIDPGYIITVILASYAALKLLWQKAASATKKLITFAVGVVVGALYLLLNQSNLHALIPSFAIAVVLYDYIIKYLLKKIKIEYKNDKN
jgi:hypothetical protein